MPQLERASDDDRFMALVITALAQPPGEREAWLRRECGVDSQLFDQAREYVESEERMGGFLLEPFCSLELFDPAFEPGELLAGRFRILRQAGQGGMAVVYEAQDEKLGERRAIKCAKAGFRTRLTPEVVAATKIAHVNVCKIFEIHTGRTDRGETDFITMEFLDGRTLTEYLQAGPLPEREARAIARQLCAGLAAAHRSQVIHGDLKSNNVILTKAANGSVRAVITDFGLARGIEPQPGNARAGGSGGAVGGARDYMAPELWLGEKPSVASDIYALGVICHEMLAGVRVRTDSLRVHPKWNRILERCLYKDPAQRYASVEKIEAALAPSDRQWMLAAAGIVLALATGVVVRQIATAPPETVRLTVSPLEGADSSINRDIARQLGLLKGNTNTSLKLVPPGKTDAATHLLHATLSQENGKLLLHAQLTDTKSSVDVKKWDAEYAPGQAKYIPIALTGVVTGTFHLPPLTTNATVNEAARLDYQKGMAAVRWDSKVDEAIAAFQRAVAEDPDSSLTFAGLAEAEWFKFYGTKDQSWLVHTTEAEKEAEGRNPDLAAVHRILGLLIYNTGSYDQAAAEFQRAIELEPNTSDAYRRLGRAFEKNGQIDKGLEAYRRAVDIEPGYYRNLQALGGFWFERGDYNEAVRHFERAVELAPGEPGVRSDLGQAYINAGQFAEMEAAFRREFDHAESQASLVEIGYSFMYRKRDLEAIPYFERALRSNAKNYVYWMYLGIAYRRSHLHAKSALANRQGFKLAEEEVARNPRNYTAHSFLAYLCAQLGDGHAESEISEALRLSPADSDTRWMAALTYEALNRREKTIAVLKGAPPGVLADLSRWPDVADLNKDSRFIQLLASTKTIRSKPQ
jgi:serine/threonine protein kinase